MSMLDEDNVAFEKEELGRQSGRKTSGTKRSGLGKRFGRISKISASTEKYRKKNQDQSSEGKQKFKETSLDEIANAKATKKSNVTSKSNVQSTLQDTFRNNVTSKSNVSQYPSEVTSTVTPKVTQKATSKDTHKGTIEPTNEKPRVLESGEHSVIFYKIMRSPKQRQLLFLLFDICRNRGSKIIEITNRELCEYIGNVSENTIKGPLRRLKESGAVKLLMRKKGQGGFQRLEISNSFYTQLELEINVNPNRYENEVSKRSIERVHQREQNHSSSSSINILSKKSLTTERRVSMPAEWLEIEISSEASRAGINQTRIAQIFGKGLYTAEEVQDSLDHFTFEIKSGESAKYDSPISVFMGSFMRNGVSFLSKAYVKHLEEKRREQSELIERYKKLKEDEEKKVSSKRFEEFLNKTPQQKIDEYVPPNSILKSGSDLQKTILKELYISGEIS